MASTHQTDFESLVDALPETAEALTTAVEILSSGGEHLQAEAILRNALHRTPLTSLRTTLARVLMEQDRHKEAMTEMVNVLRTEAENPEALLLLSRSLMECGELERGGKMLQKARLAGADREETAATEDRYRELVANADNVTFADSTFPEIHPDPRLIATPKAKKRNETLLGHPALAPQSSPSFDPETADAETSAAPTRAVPQRPGRPAPPPMPAVPPPFASEGFGKLSTWDIVTDDGEIETTVSPPEKVRLRDGAVERLPAATTPRPIPGVSSSKMSRDELASPTDHTTSLILDDDDFAAPDEHTSHIHVVEDDLASPDEHTGHIHIEDEVTKARDSLIQHVDDMPSVEYDAGFAAEAEMRAAHEPPADLDALPAWDASWDHDLEDAPTAHDGNNFGHEDDASHFPIEEGWKEDFSAPGPYDRLHLDESGPTTDGTWDSGIVAAPPAARHGAENNFVYEAAQPPVHPQQTAGALTPRDEIPVPPKAQRRWPIAVVGVTIVTLAAFVGLAFAASNSVSGELEGKLATAAAAQAPDTFNGYVAAAEELREVASVHSFMGAGFDRFTTSALPLGTVAADLRRDATAELALTTAQLEYRFGQNSDAKARLATAKADAPDHAATLIAEAYVTLAANRPAAAVALLTARQDIEDPRYREALGWANLALDRPGAAGRATENLPKPPNQSVAQRYLLASISAAQRNPDAPSAFAAVFADSPDHADARIGRAYALLSDKSKLDDAQKTIDVVLGKLATSTSPVQAARATSADGSIRLAQGDRDAAEERFRSALAKAPTRGELYLPLAELLASQNKPSEVDALLQKSRDNNAYTVPLAYFEAGYHLTRSKPEAALKTLDRLDFDDATITFLRGLALLDQHNLPAALRTVNEAKGLRDSVNLDALKELVTAMQPDGDPSSEALAKLKSTHADNAFVHWASAVTIARSAQATASRKERGELLTAARADLDRAVSLRPDWARGYVMRCELLLLELNTTQAEQACDAARKLAPDFVPALTATARLHLARGLFKDAKELSDRALQLRPDDSVVGHLAARVAIETGDLNEAQRQIDRFLGKEVDAYEQALLEGRLHFARENYTRAAGYLKEAQDLRPTDGEASIYYGHTLARLGDNDSAGALLRDYLSHPTWAGYAWAVLGEVRRKQRRLKDAYENLENALRRFRGQDVPARYYSHVYTEYALANQIKYRKWEHPQVKAMLDKGAELGDSNDSGLNMAFGLYYLNLRRPNYAQAMNYIQRVVDVAPFRCDAVEALLSLYSRANKPKTDIDALTAVQAKNCAR